MKLVAVIVTLEKVNAALNQISVDGEFKHANITLMVLCRCSSIELQGGLRLIVQKSQIQINDYR